MNQNLTENILQIYNYIVHVSLQINKQNTLQ